MLAGTDPIGGGGSRIVVRTKLTEDITRSATPLVVDRENAVIRGVKVIGLVSANGRIYSRDALSKAIPLYEGASVRINHRKGDDACDADDVFGWLKGVVLREDGLYADLHYLRAHAMAERVCEAADRNPSLYGLSHDADGRLDRSPDGTPIVGEILEVRSVDLVTDPATTRGLFEERQPITKTKIKTVFEGLLPRIDIAKRAQIKRLMEGLGDTEMDAPAEATSPEDAIKAGLRSACIAALDDESLDDAGIIAKIKEYLGIRSKVIKDKEPVEEEEDEEEEVKEEEEEDEKDMKESKRLKRRLDELERREEVRTLCESEKVVPTPTMLKALCGLDSNDERLALLRENKAIREVHPSSGQKPRNQVAGGGTNPTEFKSAADFAKALKK